MGTFDGVPTVRDAVAQEWCRVLEVEDVNEMDNFFEAGGDSLTAVELVERLETRLGQPIPVDSLFLDGTFGALLKSCQHPGVRPERES
ncbi:acyl carrier protein [Kribbella sp. NBC_00709]|uniref:acyl carrier protein n=1 Tax=Kribbella sp. NBC_00709 TaxID=2975972 RepID=UPI002E28EC35|nr:acyl carrier protein [Kribbella sp. NBC_00709]